MEITSGEFHHQVAIAPSSPTGASIGVTIILKQVMRLEKPKQRRRCYKARRSRFVDDPIPHD